MNRFFLGLYVVAFATPVAFAQNRTDDPIADNADRDGGPLIVTAYWENDGGYLKRNNLRDRHYTNGMGITVAHQPKWADDLAKHVPFGEGFTDGPLRTAAGYTAGQLMFTPDNIGLAAPQPMDRPWAGYLYGGVYWQRADNRQFDHLQLDVGVLGPSSGADEVQSGTHEWVDDTDPKGWDNQLADEPTFQFYGRRKWRYDLKTPRADNSLAIQAIPTVGVALGTVYVNAEAGATVRAGWNLPDDFGPGRLADPASATSKKDERHEGWSLYFFGRGTARLVAHDIFLAGGVFEDGPGVEERELVGEFQGGVAVAYERHDMTLAATYSQTFQTETFDGQRNGDEYGALTIALTFWD